MDPRVVVPMVLIAGQVLAYLIGSIPFGFLVARRTAGVDIRAVGSGNIGATNVGRHLGLKFFLVVFLLDFLKGAVPTGVALALRIRHPELDAFDFLPELVGLATILGHVFSIFLNLRGGKGVATTIGVLCVLTPGCLALALAVWVAAVLVWRWVALGSVLFALALVVAWLSSEPHPFAKPNLALALFLFAVSGLIVVRHRGNLVRIVNGTEPTVTLRRPPRPGAAAASDGSAPGSR